MAPRGSVACGLDVVRDQTALLPWKWKCQRSLSSQTLFQSPTPGRKTSSIGTIRLTSLGY
jgi:hypothetical protein